MLRLLFNMFLYENNKYHYHVITHKKTNHKVPINLYIYPMRCAKNFYPICANIWNILKFTLIE